MENMSTRIDELPDPEATMEVMDPQAQHDLSKYNENNSNIQFDIVKRNNEHSQESFLTQLRNQVNEENLALLAVVTVFMMSRTSNYIGNIPFLSKFGNNEFVFPIVKASLAVVAFLLVKTTVLKYMKL